MSKTGNFLHGLLIWSYERGTLQYDIICALILAFVFFVPRSCFTSKKAALSQAPSASHSAVSKK